MATKYERWETLGGSDYFGIYENYWEAQSFTPSITHILTSIKLLGYVYGGYTVGEITVSIRAVDGSNLPTGDDLSVGTYNGNTIGGTDEWFEIPMSPISLFAGTEYAIVIRVVGPDDLKLRYNIGYASGQESYSTDSGANWGHTGAGNRDIHFQEWGNPTSNYLWIEGTNLRYFDEDGSKKAAGDPMCYEDTVVSHEDKVVYS